MIRKKRNGIIWFEFELLQAFPMQHAVFARIGGVSEGAYASLDLSGRCQINRKKALHAMSDRPPSSCIEGSQVHKDVIFHATEAPHPEIVPECDGVTTSVKEKALVVKHADCQSAILYDPMHHAFTAVHVGWRGNVCNMYQKAIAMMQQLYGSRPEELIVCISPSLGPDASEFIHYKREFPEAFWRFQHKPLYFNLWEISCWQLEQAGILPQHIEIARMCTYSDSEHFFSCRREKPYGCNATIAWLTPTSRCNVYTS